MSTIAGAGGARNKLTPAGLRCFAVSVIFPITSMRDRGWDENELAHTVVTSTRIR